jgi:Mrp family chromosome partitioning ATPase
MLGRRGRLPVLAEISASPDGSRAWALRRRDLEGLEEAMPRLAARQVVLLTGEGEAPLLCAVAVAAAAAASARRTVLLECDVARPRLAALLGLAAAPGLHEYLRWEAQPQQLLQPAVLGGPAAAGVVEPLVCIAAGRPASNPGRLFGLQSFAHMLAKLRHAYDFVVLASSGALSEPEPTLALARLADAVVAGASSVEASGRAAQPLRAAIRRLPAPALGAIAVEA